MNLKRFILSTIATSSFLLAGCQEQNAGASTADSDADSAFRITMITDQNGVDDRSFNQSAWEGMQDWAASHHFPKESIHYYQSGEESNYIPNLNTALQDDYDLIYTVGYSLEESLDTIAQQNPDQKFGMLDGSVEQPNVVSISFADNESAYLAGIAAAMTSKTGKIGFVGGQQTPNILKFQAGFEAGAKDADPNVEVEGQFTESFSDAGIAQQIASAMYTNKVDVIFHAAGNAGNGVTSEARNRLEAGVTENIWVIGADRDQTAEGEWEGGNFMLTSTLKELGRAIENETNDTMNGNFHGGEQIVSNLEDGGVGIVETNLSEDIKEAIQTAKEKIIAGEIEVPETPE